jgi:hypothetical protein
MKLREKFMTVCAGCDGDGKVENEVFQMGEVKYYYTQCDCENGKEFDWRKVDDEIKDTKLKIEEYQESIYRRLQLAREYHTKKELSMVFNAIGLMIESENKVTELKTYLAELEEL